MSSAKDREKRTRESYRSPWLADRMKRSLLMEYEEEMGIESPVIESRRLGDIGDTVGQVLSLSAGGMTARQVPDVVVQAVRDAIERRFTHYPGVRGLKTLREAISVKCKRDNGIVADPDSEILPVIGCQMSIDGATRILINPGDDVLLIDPEYASIEPNIRMCGGNVIRVPLREGAEEWSFDPDELARRITPRTKLLIFSNGNNPSGVLYSRAQLQAIADLAKKHDFFILSDEEYEALTFDGLPHHSIASLPGMKQRTITAFSFSKAYCMSGFRIGYMVADAAIIDHMYNLVRFGIQACGSIDMVAALAILTSDISDWMEETKKELTEKRDFAVRRLNQMPGVRCAIPRGCYFLFPNVSAYKLSAAEMAEYLLREARISVSPGTNFGPGGEGHLRISGCVGMEALREGLERMDLALSKLPRR